MQVLPLVGVKCVRRKRVRAEPVSPYVRARPAGARDGGRAVGAGVRPEQ